MFDPTGLQLADPIRTAPSPRQWCSITRTVSSSDREWLATFFGASVFRDPNQPGPASGQQTYASWSSSA